MCQSKPMLHEKIAQLERSLLRELAALDFHHLEGKDKSVSQLVQSCRSLNAIKREIKKCIVLCSNCHRIEHFAGALD